MAKKYKSAEHEAWHKIVQGQVRSAMNDHPEWFSKFTTPRKKNQAIRSIANRAVGAVMLHVGGLGPLPHADAVAIGRTEPEARKRLLRAALTGED